jgi:hypothetical protein
MGAAIAFGIAVCMPPSALAQTNIDQGKPPSELFANYCAVCHKTTRGLANGRNSLTLSMFLREHYASSREQAASLAAYVLNAGGNAPPPKPERAKTEEPKTQEAKGHEGKPEAKPRPSSASAKPEPDKLEPDKPAKSGQPPLREEGVPAEAEPAPVAAATANQAPQPASGAETAAPEHSPMGSADISAEAPANDNAPAPRDNIPD